jgi:hypothetical protein
MRMPGLVVMNHSFSEYFVIDDHFGLQGHGLKGRATRDYFMQATRPRIDIRMAV